MNSLSQTACSKACPTIRKAFSWFFTSVFSLALMIMVPLNCKAAEVSAKDRNFLDLTPNKDNIMEFKADRSMLVRGWRVGNSAYFGQAKIGGEWGLGFVIDSGNYAYGLNNRGVAIVKKF